MISYIKDRNNLWTVVIGSKCYQFNDSNKQYNELLDCLKTENAERLVEILDKKQTISKWSDGLFYIQDGVIYYDGEQLHDSLSDRILTMINDGFNYNPMLRFVERLYNESQSYRAITELYKFLEHKSLPITPDGCFLAYKAVSVLGSDASGTDLNGRELKAGDFVDKYTKKSYRNNVGDSPSMARFKVDDNCNNGCASGLHVGSIEYVKSYASSDDKIVICKINPSSVVSVPLDSNCQKVRVDTYEVVGVYTMEFSDPVVYDYDEYSWDDESNEWDDDQYEDEDYDYKGDSI